MLASQDIDRIVLDTVAAYMPPERLSRVMIEPYVDWMDEVGLEITVVMPGCDDTPVDGEAIFDMRLALNDRLEEAGETRRPLLSFATEADLTQVDDTGL